MKLNISIDLTAAIDEAIEEVFETFPKFSMLVPGIARETLAAFVKQVVSLVLPKLAAAVDARVDPVADVTVSE